jgi:hypothetical protein
MNILEVEDALKGAPDDYLFKEMQQPSGSTPQYLVVSEIQRRTEMRKAHQANQQSLEQPTISDQILKEGIMGGNPQMAAPQQPQQPPQPQGFSSGGVIGMSGGRRSPYAPSNPNPRSFKDYFKDGVFSFFPEGNDPLQKLYLASQGIEKVWSEEQGRYVFMDELSEEERRGFSSEIPPNLVAQAGAGPLASGYQVSPSGQGGGTPLMAAEHIGLINAGSGPQAEAAVMPAGAGITASQYDDMTAGGPSIAAPEMPELSSYDDNLALLNQARSSDQVSRLEKYLGEMPGMSDGYRESVEGIAARQRGRAQDVQDRSSERVDDLKRGSRRDALSQALIAMGAGIASNDFASGLTNAGQAVAQIKNAERFETLEEQRFADAQSQAAFGAAETAELQLEAAMMQENIAKYKNDIALDSAISDEERANAQLQLQEFASITEAASQGDTVALQHAKLAADIANDMKTWALKEREQTYLEDREEKLDERAALEAVVDLFSSYERSIVGPELIKNDAVLASLFRYVGLQTGVNWDQSTIELGMAELRSRYGFPGSQDEQSRGFLGGAFGGSDPSATQALQNELDQYEVSERAN